MVLIGMIAGLGVFSLWMNIVGNPHVVETVLGARPREIRIVYSVPSRQ